MNKAYLNPTSLFNSTQFGFSQIVIADPGKLVFLSGQVAWDADGQIVGQGDLEKQTRQTFSNIKTAIETAGGTLKDIVMLRIYVVHLTDDKSAVIGPILKEYFGTQNPPASTWLGVTALASSDFLLEIEAQAIIHNS